MAEDKLPPGVTLDEALPPGVTLDQPGAPITMDTIGAQMLRNSQRELPEVSLADRGKAAALPTALSIGGRIAGRKIAGTPGEYVGESLGAGTGTGINMAVGLQQPSLWDLAQSFTAPFTGRTIGGIARQGMISGAKMMPGYAAAGHELASTQVRGIPDLVRPGTPYAPMYEQLKAMPEVQIPTRPFAQTVRKLADVESNAQDTGVLPGLQNAEMKNQLTLLADALEARPTMSFNQYWLNVQRVGAKVREYQKSESEKLGAEKLMYKYGMEGLEQAQDRFPLLKSANESMKKSLAADALHEVITNRVITPTSNGLIQIQPQILRKWLTNTENADTVKNISPQEMAGINKILNVAERLPRLPPPQGQQYGSGPKIVTGSIGTLLGGGAGYAAGGAYGAGVGAAISGPAFIAANALVSKAMQSDWGRRQLIKVMDRGPFLDHAAIAALAVAINSGSKASGSDPSKVRLGPNPLEP